MNDWDYHRKEFIKLGGKVNNLTCREGKNGRGIFRQGNRLKPKIICPPHLLISIKDIVLIKGAIRINKEANHSPEVRDFFESYHEKLSWGDTGKIEATKFLTEITEMPIEGKKFLSTNNLCDNKLLHTKVEMKTAFIQFWNSRAVKFKNVSVLAPIWEMVNHSPFADSFRKTKHGIETPNYRANEATNEIFHAYKIRSSPISIFFNYGFTSNEIFAYSLPIQIKSTNGKLIFKTEGCQKEIATNSTSITFRGNLLSIPSLPVGSISKELPRLFFYSIAEKFGLEHREAADLFSYIQQFNISQRIRLKNILNESLNDTIKALNSSIDTEINLINNSLH